jgi:hypothetical protein
MPETKSQARKSFVSWAFSTMLDLRKVVGIGVLIAAAFSIRELEPQKWFALRPDELKTFLEVDKASARANLALIQAAACFLLALLTPGHRLPKSLSRKGTDQLKDGTAEKACIRIQLLVTATFLAWTLYYLITGLSLKLESSPFDHAISVTLNTVPSVLLFWLYLELAEITVDATNLDRTERKIDEGEVAEPQRDENLTVGSDVAPTTHLAFHRVISTGVFVIITVPVWIASNRKGPNAEFVRDAFDMLSSCLNGVAIALVVGRLGSRILDLGSITLGLLYFYAVIQPTAPTFHNNPIAHVIATTVALPLKVLLWLVFVWAYTTGILAQYVRELRDFLTREYPREQVVTEQEHIL